MGEIHYWHSSDFDKAMKLYKEALENDHFMFIPIIKFGPKEANPMPYEKNPFPTLK